MIERVDRFHSSLWMGAVIMTLALGCGAEARNEEYATLEGTVKYEGQPVPNGAQLILSDKAKGVRMVFPIGSGGAYRVPETARLPAGTYNVAVMPPPRESGVTEANYDEVMNNPDAQPSAPPSDDFPVPEELRDPAKSNKSVEVQPGSHTLDIEL